MHLLPSNPSKSQSNWRGDTELSQIKSAGMGDILEVRYKAYNNKLQRMEMWSVEAKEEEVQSSVQVEDAKAEDIERVIQVKKQAEAKNRKWPEAVHAKYILFLELNRQKIKSKLIRRSNSFYNEMALFIKDKSGVQCRSHHQKFELRYKYPHRIIREEKLKISELIYNEVKAAFTNVAAPSSFNHIADPFLNSNTNKTPKVSPKMKTISCQTQLEGVDKTFLKPEELNDYYYWMSQYYSYPQPSPPHLMMQWTAANHFPQMGSPYFNGTF